MMHQYSYFEFRTPLYEARALIERAAGLVLSERDSYYMGGEYFRFTDGSGETRLKLHNNVDPRGGWIDDEFEGVVVVCSVSGPIDAVQALAAQVQMAGGRLLISRTADIDDEEE